ncbi:predicted protein [Histoplasma capsulatum G186AR]|uniref:Uncharacterized protein n=1 Tax=Ajellomyces capsulatus (strain G186AR / H82 / ATCC MYA-2454 / RMSCC 2432) TaxID=447093 RepID=C0NPF6_AJECG|nr:uncharacterized protein HCBG_05036 [Histoplasma capsulatum G186AR]EEH06816.1 predicted protein [Histoplasma capsulatum G186AR]
MDQIHPSTAAKELKAIGDREYSQQSAVGLVSYSYALFPSQGHPTDFRRVEFTMPQYDKEDALSDNTPSDSSALYHVSKREKLYHEAKLLKEKLTENTDVVRLRLLRQHT